MVRWFTLFGIIGFLLLWGGQSVVYAQQPASGIGLKPALIEEGADPGARLERNLEVSNLSDSEQTYYLFVRDITTVKDGGTPVFADEGAEKTGFEISEWIELAQTEVKVAAGGSANVPVVINIPTDASPGSHFGGIFISLEPPRLRELNGASVGFEVANIVSIRISGEAIEDTRIRSFQTNSFVYGSTNVDFIAVLENKGNVLARPIGPLEIKNMFGKLSATMNFNENQGGVFPGIQREFKATWKDGSVGFGRYEAVLTLVYGEPGNQKTIFQSVSFWILPTTIILPALGGLIFLLMLVYFGVRLYVRRAMATYIGARKIVRSRERQGASPFLVLLLAMLATTSLFLLVLLMLFA